MNSAPTTRPSAITLVALAAILAVAAWLRWHDLGAECFDCDELYAIRIQGTSFRDLGAVLGRTAFKDVHPPASYVSFLYWTALVGESESAVRALPALLGVAAVGLMFLLGRQVLDDGTGLLAAGLLAVNPLHVAYSQEARPYALLVAATVATHVCLLRALRHGRSSDRALYGLAALVALYTHYFAVLALVAHGVFLGLVALTRPAACRRSALSLILTLILAAVLFSSWCVVFPHQRIRGGSYLGSPGAQRTLAAGAEMLGVGHPPTSFFALATLATVAGFGLWGTRRAAGVPASAGPDRPKPGPQPGRSWRWFGVGLCGLGVVGLLAAYVAFPSRILPAATEMLRAQGYPDQVIAYETRILHVLILAVPASVSLAGAVILLGPFALGALERMPPLLGDWKPSAAAFVLIVAGLPALLMAALGFLGGSLTNSRNLLVLAPGMNLAVALGMRQLFRSGIGSIAAMAVLLLMGCLTTRYQPLRFWSDTPGERVGMHTGPWRELREQLRSLMGPSDQLILAHGPPTDPALHYLKELSPHRLESARQPVPDFHARPIEGTQQYLSTLNKERVFLLSLAGDPFSAALREDLVKMGYGLRETLRLGEFAVFECRIK